MAAVQAFEEPPDDGGIGPQGGAMGPAGEIGEAIASGLLEAAYPFVGLPSGDTEPFDRFTRAGRPLGYTPE
jgi:hypothetical protein